MLFLFDINYISLRLWVHQLVRYSHRPFAPMGLSFMSTMPIPIRNRYEVLAQDEHECESEMGDHCASFDGHIETTHGWFDWDDLEGKENELAQDEHECESEMGDHCASFDGHIETTHGWFDWDDLEGKENESEWYDVAPLEEHMGDDECDCGAPFDEPMKDYEYEACGVSHATMRVKNSVLAYEVKMRVSMMRWMRSKEGVRWMKLKLKEMNEEEKERIKMMREMEKEMKEKENEKEGEFFDWYELEEAEMKEKENGKEGEFFDWYELEEAEMKEKEHGKEDGFFDWEGLEEEENKRKRMSRYKEKGQEIEDAMRKDQERHERWRRKVEMSSLERKIKAGKTWGGGLDQINWGRFLIDDSGLPPV